MLKALKRGIVAFFLAYVGKYLLRAILSTCRLEVEGLERYHRLAKKESCILMLWHNRLAMVSEILNKLTPQYLYAAVISKSKDGDPLAVLAGSYKNGKSIRVPHNARHQALRSVIDTLKGGKEIIIITPDGPRGPRYKVKPGIIAAAKETQAKIVPFSWTATKFWQLNSWDRLIFPKPFSTLSVTFGEPIQLKEIESGDIDQNHSAQLLEQSLLDIESKTLQTLFKDPCEAPQ